MMPEPEFKVGDKVVFEIRGSNENYPRWDFSEDNGGSGIGAIGKVLEVTDYYVFVEDTRNGVRWNWPLSAHDDYCPTQWLRPGWLAHVVPLECETEEKPDNVCTCATLVVVNCGCPSANGLPCPNKQELY
jgi:hypothetical protein